MEFDMGLGRRTDCRKRGLFRVEDVEEEVAGFVADHGWFLRQEWLGGVVAVKLCVKVRA